MALAKHDHVIKKLTPDRADEALDVRILPRRPGRCECFGHLEPGDSLAEVTPEDGIAIAQEVARCGVPRERLDDLLPRPLGGRVLSDVEVEHAPAVVGEHYEDEEDAEGH